MARSVSLPNNTEYVEYNACEFEDSFEFDMAVEGLQDALQEVFPSVSACNEWVGREDRAVAENKYAYFGVSEYCGLVAVWCAAKEASYYDNAGFEGLRDRWISQIGDKFRKTARGSFGQALVKTGSFSNGEAFFQAAAGANKGELGLGYSSKEGWI